jgi:hypothetical protein
MVSVSVIGWWKDDRFGRRREAVNMHPDKVMEEAAR